MPTAKKTTKAKPKPKAKAATVRKKPAQTIVLEEVQVSNVAVATGSIWQNWLPIGGAVVLIAGMIYMTLQQSIRMNANDPQIQIAEDMATAIANNEPSRTLVAAFDEVDMAKSLAPFVIVVDDSGELAYASGTLNGETPIPPMGSLEYASEHGQNRLTWEPVAGVRIATVITRIDSEKHAGWVVAGRNLREVEMREDMLVHQIEVLTLLTLAATLLLAWAGKYWPTN